MNALTTVAKQNLYISIWCDFKILLRKTPGRISKTLRKSPVSCFSAGIISISGFCSASSENLYLILILFLAAVRESGAVCL